MILWNSNSYYILFHVLQKRMRVTVVIASFSLLHHSLYLLVSWAWWDWPLTWLTNHRCSVLWHCWLGHVTRKTVSEMTYNVSSGTLNTTILYHTVVIAGVCQLWRRPTACSSRCHGQCSRQLGRQGHWLPAEMPYRTGLTILLHRSVTCVANCLVCQCRLKSMFCHTAKHSVISLFLSVLHWDYHMSSQLGLIWTISQTRRALGGAHVPPTKLFRWLTASVNETIVKPRITAALGHKTILKPRLAAATNTYTSYFSDIKFCVAWLTR